MSLLMYLHESDNVLIVTDTLATVPSGESLMFQSKAWPLPHLNMAIAVTGIANVGAIWNDRLRNLAVARDIADVNTFAPSQLREIYAEVMADPPDDVGSTSATLYHFGFEHGSDRAVRYTYRSHSDFEPERHDEPGFGVKPPPRDGNLEPPETSDDVLALALRIRAEQDALPADERVCIGGELYLTFVQNWSTQTRRLHRFDDYESSWEEMIARLNRENSDR